MQKINKRIAARIVFIFLSVFFALYIFMMSGEPAEMSDTRSSAVTEIIISIIHPDFKSLDDGVQLDMIETANGFIRKLAHFTAFGVLSVLVFFAALTFEMPLYEKYFTATLIASIYAVTDEIHQLYVPGRSCQFTDVLIDSAGAWLFALIAFLITKRIINSRKRRQTALL